MDFNSLFKAPKYTAGVNKRKLPDNPTPEFLKKIKLDHESNSVHGAFSSELPANGFPSKGKARSVTVEEVPDVAIDASFAPGGDADYFAEEDDEGRFFGGGLTGEQKEILNIFDEAGDDGPEVDGMSITSIRRLLLQFDRAANKNQDQRSKYPDDPTKFIDSEADLDSAIKSLMVLAESPGLAYPELVKSGALTKLIGLLSHENADIAIDIVEILHELTDEDVGDEAEDPEAEDRKIAEEALKMLVDSLLENSILELLVDNLSRLNEDEEGDRQGVFHILAIFENVLGVRPSLSSLLVSKTSILSWIFARIQIKTHDENRGYAAELLSILLQDNRDNRLAFGEKDGVEVCLKVVDRFRRRNPNDTEEEEFMDNVFDSLCSALSEEPVKKLFLDAEGPDLMALMMRENRACRSRAIKVLNYAMSGSTGTKVCETFVEAGGLKTLFAVFMGKFSKKHKGDAAPPLSEDTAHILGVISSLFSNLESDSAPRIRVLTKFVEKDFEKVDRLLDVRESAGSRLEVTVKEIAKEKAELLSEGEEVGEEEEDTWYLRRLDGGLFTLQTVDYILAWIVMEDDGIREHTVQMLRRRDLSLKNIVDTLRIYHDNVDDEPAGSTGGGAPSQKDILAGLIDALEGAT
ncbi:DUF1716-domain-containing protein [Fistulina hepatica ATCC 64428]|nr:DUF1716-domain-containing protein [Fistulina hepatica ATCC 64428]